MKKRIAAICFPELIINRMIRKQPELGEMPFAFARTERGARVIISANKLSQQKGVRSGMTVADGKAIVPELRLFDYKPEEIQKILSALAEWCIRFSPQVAVDFPDGLLVDAIGCTHLWGGEKNYLADIQQRFDTFGYTIQTAMADTIGTAWAVSRYGASGTIVPPGKQAEFLFNLPAIALRPENLALERLEKLGLKTIGSFMNMPRTALLRRFGKGLLTRLGQAMGDEPEILDPVKVVAPYEERLPCLEPIRTAKGIEIGMKMLLEMLCQRLGNESKGLRKCELHCYRIDGQIKKIETGTSRPSRNPVHLFRLFEQEIQKIAPGLGIELFVLTAPIVEPLSVIQDALWSVSATDEVSVAELLDRLAGKVGAKSIHRYLPAEHHWPEYSVKESAALTESTAIEWRTDLPRPLHLLKVPEPIEVSVPVPDYPPMLFRYKGLVHNVKKADGPERIEQEWWIEAGLFRDYYCIEDELGARYWLFRAGEYGSGNARWFVHGFFA